MWCSHGTHDPTSAVVAHTRATQHSVMDGRGLRRFHSSLGCYCQGMVVVFLSGVTTDKLLYSPINSFPPTLTQALESVGHQKEQKKKKNYMNIAQGLVGKIRNCVKGQVRAMRVTLAKIHCIHV